MEQPGEQQPCQKCRGDAAEPSPVRLSFVHTLSSSS
jgi:hypothetical protein